jgi:hypothetical protein
MNPMRFLFNDGGRAAAGHIGRAGDCVTRAIAIVTGKPYGEVYLALNKLGASERIGKRKKKKSKSDSGVFRRTYQRYLESLGWRWTPTMSIGSGCTMHLRSSELPQGVLIARVSRHLTAVIDGVIHDTHDCSRGGTRCVYGFFALSSQPVLPLNSIYRISSLNRARASFLRDGLARSARDRLSAVSSMSQNASSNCKSKIVSRNSCPVTN